MHLASTTNVWWHSRIQETLDLEGIVIHLHPTAITRLAFKQRPKQLYLALSQGTQFEVVRVIRAIGSSVMVQRACFGTSRAVWLPGSLLEGRISAKVARLLGLPVQKFSALQDGQWITCPELSSNLPVLGKGKHAAGAENCRVN